jgi:hypothetical protein
MEGSTFVAQKTAAGKGKLKFICPNDIYSIERVVRKTVWVIKIKDFITFEYYSDDWKH